MAAKISKDELAQILKGIFAKEDFDSMQEQIEKVADEYGIDLTDIDQDEDVILEDVSELMNDDLFRDPNGDDEDEDY